MMNNYKKEQILSILQSSLGVYSSHSNDECSFNCPFCHHHKKKLAVNILTESYHCWVCGSKGKSLYRLMKRLNADESTLSQLRSIIGKRDVLYEQYDTEEVIIFQLPKEYVPMWSATRTYEWKHAHKYLMKRGVTNEDIIKYGIGYCSDGVYKNFIIVPSYAKNGRLNYFVARNYYKSDYKYKNPTISKDVVMFENMISWNLPIILTEGVFDAIAIKRNVIPLLGKEILPTLWGELTKHAVKEVYVILDADAKDNALRLAYRLQNQHIKTHFVELGELDPSDLGFEKITKKIKQSSITDFTDLIKLKF